MDSWNRHYRNGKYLINGSGGNHPFHCFGNAFCHLLLPCFKDIGLCACVTVKIDENFMEIEDQQVNTCSWIVVKLSMFWY